jgi:hypothetical protein
MNEEPRDETPQVDKEAPDLCAPTKAPVTEAEPIHAPLTEAH